MVLTMPMFSMKPKSLRFAENWYRYLFVGLSVILLIVFNVYGIALVIFLYILLNAIFYLLKVKFWFFDSIEKKVPVNGRSIFLRKILIIHHDKLNFRIQRPVFLICFVSEIITVYWTTKKESCFGGGKKSRMCQINFVMTIQEIAKPYWRNSLPRRGQWRPPSISTALQILKHHRRLYSDRTI